MIELQPFQPTGDTVLIAATTTSGQASIPFGPAAAATLLRVYNDGPSMVFVTVGKTTAIASIKSVPIGVGNTQVINKGPNDTVAAMTLTTTANVYFSPGNGITT